MYTKLLNTLLGVVMVAIALRLPGSTFIIRNFFNDIPKDIENSALVDGCNRLTAFSRSSSTWSSRALRQSACSPS